MLMSCGSDGKASACNAGDLGSIPGSGRSPGEGHGNPLQDSCLENPTDRGAWWATVHRVARVRHHLATQPPPTTPHQRICCLVTKLCPTLCEPWTVAPGSSVHGTLQARILEWVAISFSRGSSRPRDQTQVSRIVGRRFTV